MITEVDALVGENVRRLRGNMSQEDVASKMRTSYGHAWKKQTVYNIEAGQRQLKLSEARDLLNLFGYDGDTDFSLLFRSSGDMKLEAEAKYVMEQACNAEVACFNTRQAMEQLRSSMEAEPAHGYGEAAKRMARMALQYGDTEKLESILADILNGKAMPRYYTEEKTQHDILRDAADVDSHMAP
ncbi:helix-turn-helix transcriptional regulator [Bifidobacterium sp. SO4]|uniref:helix-turn-helix transcriptional regulator n=1 Tax=Bifidobacterium sp. SO4 TaxID=2809030 RepID=UPI001BDBF464|nr:helix-turn-helix transcriptional regulator [Bifidobacterium sp. SO4]MBT1169593.1 helix-turn-helix transcriptional regulator [Bifidobacterium sp. SO4]